MTDDDGQRSTDDPTSAALVGFLEADLDRGLRLAWRAETEWEVQRQIPSTLFNEIESVDIEIRRWLGRAVVRGIATGHLRSRIDQFTAALANVRRCSSGEAGRP